MAEPDIAALLAELRNRAEFRWNVPDWIDLEGLIAALERAERVEAAAREAVEAHDTHYPDDPVIHRAMWKLGEVLSAALGENGDGT